jgi:hypothetical protein
MFSALLSALPATAGVFGQLQRGLLATYLTVVAIVCGFLIINGAQISVARDADRVRVTETEDRAFCSRLIFAFLDRALVLNPSLARMTGCDPTRT